MIKVFQAVTKDSPNLELSTGLQVIAGLLYVPLSSGGKDFIVFLRKGQPRDIHWAGRPHKQGVGDVSGLEPRKSFCSWTMSYVDRRTNGNRWRIVPRLRKGMYCYLRCGSYSTLCACQFIEVWRQKETALQTTKLTNILLSDVSHEGQFGK